MKKNIILRTMSLLVILLALTPSIASATEKLFIPSRPQVHAPLFVALHGCLSHAEDSEKATRMSEFGEKYGFYVLYPEPSLGEDSKGCFDFYTDASQQPGGGDGAVLVARIQELLRTYDIDANKIYVLGMSGGASLVSVLTSCYPTVFRGAAIHSGMGYGLASTWQESLMIAQTGPIPLHQRNTACSPSNYSGKMFLIQGTRDQVMNPRHFFGLKKDYFANTQTNSKFIGPELNRYGYIHQTFYQDNVLRGHGVLVLGLNHEWSGADPLNSIGPRGPDVSTMIVNYFLENP